MKKAKLVSVGDVIKSEKFAYGTYEHEIKKKRDGTSRLALDKKLIKVDGGTKSSLVGFVREYKRSGESVSEECDVGAYNSGRGNAYFVVEAARYQGGGSGGGVNDVYPDGWHVEARRLNTSQKYDPNGEVISFYQTGFFNYMVKDPEIVEKMKINFVRGKRK